MRLDGVKDINLTTGDLSDKINAKFILVEKFTERSQPKP